VNGFIWPDESWEELGDDSTVEPPALEVEVSENEVLATLLGPDGEVIRTLLARPPVGFALPTQ
jgi:hypothetical protein